MIQGKTEIFPLVTWNQNIRKKHRSRANDFIEVFTEKKTGEYVGEQGLFSALIFLELALKKVLGSNALIHTNMNGIE